MRNSGNKVGINFGDLYMLLMERKNIQRETILVYKSNVVVIYMVWFCGLLLSSVGVLYSVICLL